MSVSDNVAKHKDEIENLMQEMQAAMMKSETGAIVINISQEMSTSQEMVNFMSSISSAEASEEERMILAGYMGEALKADPVNGLTAYAEHLSEIAKSPEHAIRKTYYEQVAHSVEALNSSAIFKKYVEAYIAFENDESPEAKNAKDITQRMQQKAKDIVEE